MQCSTLSYDVVRQGIVHSSKNGMALKSDVQCNTVQRSIKIEGISGICSGDINFN
jgi:hypothetical protein